MESESVSLFPFPGLRERGFWPLSFPSYFLTIQLLKFRFCPDLPQHSLGTSFPEPRAQVQQSQRASLPEPGIEAFRWSVCTNDKRRPGSPGLLSTILRFPRFMQTGCSNINFMEPIVIENSDRMTTPLSILYAQSWGINVWWSYGKLKSKVRKKWKPPFPCIALFQSILRGELILTFWIPKENPFLGVLCEPHAGHYRLSSISLIALSILLAAKLQLKSCIESALCWFA